jgi:hypothetical protein
MKEGITNLNRFHRQPHHRQPYPSDCINYYYYNFIIIYNINIIIINY